MPMSNWGAVRTVMSCARAAPADPATTSAAASADVANLFIALSQGGWKCVLSLRSGEPLDIIIRAIQEKCHSPATIAPPAASRSRQNAKLRARNEFETSPAHAHEFPLARSPARAHPACGPSGSAAPFCARMAPEWVSHVPAAIAAGAAQSPPRFAAAAQVRRNPADRRKGLAQKPHDREENTAPPPPASPASLRERSPVRR